MIIEFVINSDIYGYEVWLTLKGKQNTEGDGDIRKYESVTGKGFILDWEFMMKTQIKRPGKRW